jgi:hypothetical protein
MMKHVDPNQVSLFRVSLPCGFAPKIGCGSLARPVLLALERTLGIVEAWLNQAGTLLAVVGSKTFTAERCARVVKATLQAEDIATEELRGQARAGALEDFLAAGTDWLRGTNVDQLSSREAAIIAARLVKRLQRKTAVSEQAARSLAAAIAAFFKRRFLRDRIEPEQVDHSGEELIKIATAYLDERSMGAFANALEEGYRRGPGES